MFRAAIASLVLLRSSGFVAPAARLSATAPRAEAVSTEPEWEVTMSGLKFVDDKVGDGEQPEKGSIVRVEYTGWLAASDFKFDSSVDRGVPFIDPAPARNPPQRCPRGCPFWAP